MSKDPETRLHAYLQDHLAGALEAVELLKDARERWGDEAVAAFFEVLQAEVEADKGALEGVLDRLGAAPSLLKSAGAMASERMMALRQRLADERLALLETLESLLLGVHGKHALWNVVGEVARTNTRLGDVDFEALGRRAEAQLERIEQHRRAAARAAFLDAG